MRLFALLRERAGAEAIELELPAGARVRDALERVRWLTEEVPVVMAVNHEYAGADAVLHAGDELALIPPVSGGEGAAVGSGSPSARPGSNPSGAESSPGARSPHARVTREPLALDPLLELVRHPGAGAVVTFLGVTRDVTKLDYEAYMEMAQTKIAEIVIAAVRVHGLCAAAAEHRIGVVPLSEPSVAVAVSAPHRAQAFAGAREIIDEIKARTPIWKREQGEWVRGAMPSPPP